MADQENEISQELENEADLYMEPKPKPKVVRVLTVLAYMLSVSMAAILLSVYYIFMWDGQPTLARMIDPQIDPDEYNYTDIYQRNIENITTSGFTEFTLQKNMVDENFTDYSIKTNKSTNYEVIVENNQLVDFNKSDISEKLFDQPTELYDLYPSTSTITPTEDNLLDDINDEIEESTISYPSHIKNKLFYSKYLYRKLRML